MNEENFNEIANPNFPSDQPLLCRCGWRGFRTELVQVTDLEQTHPHNKNNPRCTFTDRSDCHYTKFEDCPKCKGSIFADEREIGNLN